MENLVATLHRASLDNRPFLRCLHGYGLCLWRLGLVDEALDVFDWMLWLNPTDNQGARFLRADLRAGDVVALHADVVHMTAANATRDAMERAVPDQPDKSDPERSHHSDALGYCALGAMSPLLPDKYKVRRSKTITIW